MKNTSLQIFLPQRFFFIFLLFIVRIVSLAQTPKIDSLLNELQTIKEDTSKIKILDKLSTEFISLTDNESAMKYVDKELVLSQKVNYKKGIANSFMNYSSIYRSHGDFDKAMSYQKKALTLMQDLNFKKGISDCHLAIGSLYSQQGSYKDALDYLFLGLKIKKAMNDKKAIANGYNMVGNAYKNKGDYAKGLSYNLQALKIREEINDEKGISKSYNNIGLIYKREGKNKEALNMYNKALKLQEKLKDKKDIAILYNNIGDIHMAEDHYKEGIQFYMRALTMQQETKDNLAIIITYSSLGDAYVKQDRPDEALSYFLKSLAQATKVGFKKQIVNSNNGLGQVYEKKKQYLKALDCYTEMLKIALESGFKSGERDAYIGLASVSRKLSQFDNALRYTELFHAINDSLLNKENFKQVSELNVQYETDKKEKEILLLTRDQELNAKTIKQQKIIRWGLIGGLGLLFISVFSIYRRYHFKQKANLILEKQKHEIQEKNVLITDSIDYAKTIQEVVLPDNNLIKALFPHSFVLYQPKEIVSGDFYWVKGVGSKTLCAVADCNEQGVPGAFMSMLGYNMLENVTQKERNTPVELLNSLNSEIIERLSNDKSKSNYTLKIALISIDSKTNQLHYAGANIPIYIVRQNKLIELTADIRDIGATEKTSQHRFRPQIIGLQQGDMIYLSTKGFKNQLTDGSKQNPDQLFHDLLIQSSQLDTFSQLQKLKEMYTYHLKEKQVQVNDVLVMGIRYGNKA